MQYQASDISSANSLFANVIDGCRTGEETAIDMLIAAIGCILPFDASLCVVNHVGHKPVYLADSYPAGDAKAAVQTYVTQTYLLNPVYNSLLEGGSEGIYLMADLAPDGHADRVAPPEMREEGEEIGYRTPGWPSGMEELVVLVRLEDGLFAEISVAREAAKGGMGQADIERLRPFYPLIATAYRAIWREVEAQEGARQPGRMLEEFGREQLSPREAQIVQMVLKGHSSHSISLNLSIALPTVKTHRRHAYAKLDIASQQQLFQRFLEWQGGAIV